MKGSEFDERGFFAAIAASGARVLLVGRRAMIAHGVPVLTADYDLWVHADDVKKLNDALLPLDLFPNYSPEQARARGRYVLENDQHVDVLVARQQSTKDGEAVRFDDVWSRRVSIAFDPTVSIIVPSIDDLILTKRWAMRQKDVSDIQLLVAHKGEEDGER